MAKDEIVEKLEKFIANRSAIKEECEVVYILVELRKLLDRIEEFNSGLKVHTVIRYYADWALHISKKGRKYIIKKYVQKIANSVPGKYFVADHADFVTFRSLRYEIIKLFERFKYKNNNFKNDNFWQSFVVQFVNILSDQPIINPIPEVKKFIFEGAQGNTISWRIEFNDSRGVKPYAMALLPPEK